MVVLGDGGTVAVRSRLDRFRIQTVMTVSFYNTMLKYPLGNFPYRIRGSSP